MMLHPKHVLFSSKIIKQMNFKSIVWFITAIIQYVINTYKCL